MKTNQDNACKVMTQCPTHCKTPGDSINIVITVIVAAVIFTVKCSYQSIPRLSLL